MALQDQSYKLDEEGEVKVNRDASQRVAIWTDTTVERQERPIAQRERCKPLRVRPPSHTAATVPRDLLILAVGLRVLAIPELNQNVFDLADRNTRAVAGRTCRAWSSPALDALYRSVESLLPLLHLLSPLRPDTSDNKTVRRSASFPPPSKSKG